MALADSGIIKPKHPTFRRFGRQFQVCGITRQREKKRVATCVGGLGTLYYMDTIYGCTTRGSMIFGSTVIGCMGEDKSRP